MILFMHKIENIYEYAFNKTVHTLLRGRESKKVVGYNIIRENLSKPIFTHGIVTIIYTLYQEKKLRTVAKYRVSPGSNL